MPKIPMATARRMCAKRFWPASTKAINNIGSTVLNTGWITVSTPRTATAAQRFTRPQQRFNWPEAVNSLTSANSAPPYRDELFGPDFATSVFMSEPAQNVVHREILEPRGVTFTSHRPSDEQDREFLASTDNCFRPTMLKTGPDGALYIADIYRLVLEHPEWIPADTQKSLDLRAGADKGRIYRIYPAGAKLRPIPHLDKLTTEELVKALD